MGISEFEGIVGKSAGMKHVLSRARIVAPTDANVLLLGESGTGKELLARAIHRMSARKDQSFIKVNFAAIPAGLLESELFGHEKGAFTGATEQKIGRLEVADQGTLLLDEIGDIPLELQPKLLEVLRDHKFERLGSTRSIEIDVRVIAATRRDLHALVERGQFRADLFQRLNVFPLHLPALRERREDIPPLVHFFVDKLLGKLGRRIEIIPDATMKALVNWDWPGNIRELENLIERAVIQSHTSTLNVPLEHFGIRPDEYPS